MKKILLSFLLGTGLILCLPVFAADVYVSETGSDATGLGSEASPFATVTQALGAITGGDTIYCQGNITDSITLTAAHSGTAGSYTTITSWPGYDAVLNGNGADTVFFIDNDTQYIKIDDLALTNAVTNGIQTNGIADNIIISNNLIYGLTGGSAARALVLSVTNSQITDNDLNGGATMGDGLYLMSCDNLTIAKNKIHDYLSNGMFFDVVSQNSTVVNNWIYNIGGGMSAYSAGVFVGDSHDIQILNNSFYNIYDLDYPASGISVATSSYDCYNITVKNNIIVVANYGFSSDYNYTGLEVDHNLYNQTNLIGSVAGAEFSTLAEWQAGTIYDDNSVSGDANFQMLVAGNENLHIWQTSAAIDAGENLAEVITDFDGEDRPYNITDIGADEAPLVATPDSLSSNPKVRETTLSWLTDSNYPVTGYNIAYNVNEDVFNGTFITGNQNAVVTITGLKPAKKYYAKVQAYYETAYDTYLSDYSDTLTFGTKPARVEKTKNLITVHNYSQWRWKKQSRVFNYVIKLMDENGEVIQTIQVKKKKKFVNNANNKFVKYSISGLESGKTYMIKIRAKKKVNGEWLKGKWSITKTFSTMADSGPEL
ncbi:MAG: right-handed parallel beta-helix repeat-containing protein [Patescibacteria group bacterium]|jgi:hypothetical protein